MIVRITVEREYEMDEHRVLTEPGFEPPPLGVSEDTEQAWLRESFYELCGFERDQDHIDGSYVRLLNEHVDADFEWPSRKGEPE